MFGQNKSAEAGDYGISVVLTEKAGCLRLDVELRAATELADLLARIGDYGWDHLPRDGEQNSLNL